MQTVNNIGKEVTRLREAKGWSKSLLSRKACLSVNTVQRLEDESIKKIPGFSTIIRLSKAFDVPLDHWLDFVELGDDD